MSPSTSKPSTPPVIDNSKSSRLRSVLGWIVVTPWLGTLAAWLVGRAVGDRFLWSQYLEWIPTESIVLSGLVVVLLEGLLRGRKARRTRIPSLVVAAMLGWLLLGEWSLWRAVMPKPGGPDMRITFMNISPGGRDADIGAMFDAGGDIVVLSNVHPQRNTFKEIYGVQHSELLERSVGLVPGESPPSEVHTLRHGSFHIFSRWPIRRRASAHVGPQESWIEGDIQGGAGILMFEIDAPAGPLVVWAVDMPRTLGASRRALFEEASARIAGVERVLETDELGRWRLTSLRPDDPVFTPDVVLGDFNTPGHAWSVSRFQRGLRPARADTGFGPAGTFPSLWPLFEIDLARLGPEVKAVDAGRIRCEGCRHLGLWLDLVR